ncbi:MAG TPA: hypothetical protein VII96_12255 [Acidimicrobiales bacterium]
MPKEYEAEWAAYHAVFERARAIDPQLAHDFDAAAMAIKRAQLDAALLNGLRGQELEGELTLGRDGPTVWVRMRTVEEVPV